MGCELFQRLTNRPEYVGVPDIEAALAEAERLGGKRQMGPERAPTGLVIGHFTDPEGNLIGVAGTA